MGAKWVNKVRQVQKKRLLFKTDLAPHGMPKQVFLAYFELVVAHFGPPKIKKNLEKWVVLVPKMGQKWIKKAFFQK